MLTNDELYMDPKTGVVTIINNGTMNMDKTLTASSKIVSDMIDNDDFNGQIQRTYLKDNGCWVDYTDDGAIITMNDWTEEGENWFYEVSDEKGGITYDDHKNVAHIILGHELIHATHHMNGTMPMNVNLIFHLKEFKTVVHYDKNLNLAEEYNTVGLTYFAPVLLLMRPDLNNILGVHIPSSFMVSENILRSEQGLAKRTAY